MLFKKKGKKDGEVFCETSKVQTSNDNGKKERKIQINKQTRKKTTNLNQVYD
jgi:uncharacterized Zn finger protein (UPF0148 family)